VTEVVTEQQVVMIMQAITIPQTVTQTVTQTVVQTMPVLQMITVPHPITIPHTITIPQVITYHDIITVVHSVPISVPVTRIMTVPQVITMYEAMTIPLFITTPVSQIITLTQIITVTEPIIVPPTEIITATETITKYITEIVTEYITTTQLITPPLVTQPPLQQPITTSDNVIGTGGTSSSDITLDTFNLTLQQSDGDTVATPSSPLVYLLSYANLGTIDVINAVITETIPLNTKFDQVLSSSGWACPHGISAGMHCTFEIGQVLADTYGAVSFVVTVDDIEWLDGVDKIHNRAIVADIGQSNLLEVTYDDNEDQAFTSLSAPTGLVPAREENIYWHYLPLITR